MQKPTCEQIWEDELGEPIYSEFQDMEDGGTRINVYKRDDDTYWEVGYRVSTDGETNGLREGDAHICQVKPETQLVTVYVAVEDIE